VWESCKCYKSARHPQKGLCLACLSRLVVCRYTGTPNAVSIMPLWFYVWADGVRMAGRLTMDTVGRLPYA